MDSLDSRSAACNTLRMAKRSNTPIEESGLAKWIVDHMTIEAVTRPQKNSATGRLGEPEGGKARAKKLSSNKRRAIVRQAAKVRWSKKDESQ